MDPFVEINKASAKYYQLVATSLFKEQDILFESAIATNLHTRKL